MNRIKAIKKIREKLKSGLCSIGSWIQLSDASAAEIMGSSGYDWIAIDMEHGSISNNQLPELFRALELGGTLPLVRLADDSSRECKQALDAGAGGLIIPMIESDSQLEKVIKNSCWPPTGSRGVAFQRANMYGERFEAYIKEAQEPLMIAMIETSLGLKNIHAILDVKGLDAIIIGPYDLSASLGVTGKFESAKFKNALKIIFEAAVKKNIPIGIHVVDASPDELQSRISEGYQFIPYSIDTVMLRTQAKYEN